MAAGAMGAAPAGLVVGAGASAVAMGPVVKPGLGPWSTTGIWTVYREWLENTVLDRLWLDREWELSPPVSAVLESREWLLNWSPRRRARPALLRSV